MPCLGFSFIVNLKSPSFLPETNPKLCFEAAFILMRVFSLPNFFPFLSGIVGPTSKRKFCTLVLDSSRRLRPAVHSTALFSQSSCFDKNPVGKTNRVTDDGILEFTVKPNSCHHYQDEARTATFICGVNPLMSADETGSEKCGCSAVGLFLREGSVSSRKKAKHFSKYANCNLICKVSSLLLQTLQ